jgi:transmembrane sensor
MKFFGRGQLGEETVNLQEALNSSARRFGTADPDTARQWLALSAAIATRTHRTPADRRFRVSSILRPAIALGALGGIVAVALVTLREPGDDRTTYETMRGEQTTLSLADGSEVQVNHTSALMLEAGAGEDARRLSLRGEAYFRVTKTGAPFVVTTEVGTVTVLGTEFNVRAREGKMEVAVIKGSVSVAGGINGTGSPVLLTAGELTRCRKDEAPSPPERLRHASYPGWIHGQLLFDRTPLSAVCRELEDHFDVSLQLRVPRADEIEITGALDAKNADRAVAALAMLTGAEYSHDQSIYSLY